MENFSALMIIIAPLILIGVIYVSITASDEFVYSLKGRIFGGLAAMFITVLMVLVIIADGSPR